MEMQEVWLFLRSIDEWILGINFQGTQIRDNISPIRFDFIQGKMGMQIVFLPCSKSYMAEIGRAHV